jgi:hypothetical protein
MVGFVTELPGLDSDFCFGARIRSKGNTGFWGGKKKEKKKKEKKRENILSQILICRREKKFCQMNFD